MKEHRRGILFGFSSSVTNSTFTVYTKYLMQFVNQLTLMPLWFMSASVILFFAALYSRRKKLFGDLGRHWKAGLIMGATNLVAAGFFFTSVRIIGPAPSAFLAKFDVIFIVLLGAIFLKERLNSKELIGIMIAIVGGFVFAFSSKSLTANFYIGILAGLGVALNTLFARFYTQNVPISVLQLYRTSISAVGFLIIALAAGFFAIPEPRLILLIASGALINAVAGVGLYYAALKRVKASVAAIIRNIDPFFVAIYAFIIFQTLPTLKEVIGGTVIIAGVAITILAMNRSYSKNYKNAGETQTIDA